MIIGHVDPGVHGHGMAVGYGTWTERAGVDGPLVTYEPGELLAAAYAHSPLERGRGPAVWQATAHAALETWAPWIGRLDALQVETQYVREGSGRDMGDMLQVAAALGWFAGQLRVPLGRVLGRAPGEWTKGGKKPPRHARARASLSAVELARVVDAGNARDREDLWDAIALQRARAGLIPLIWR